jgi:WD40 repeat protein
MLAPVVVCAALRVALAAQGVPVIPTIVSPKTATKPAGAHGFLQRWLILDPIPVSGQLADSAVRATVSRQYFPNQFTTIPKEGETVTVDGKPRRWHAVDTTNYNVNLFHFAAGLKEPTSNVLFWAITLVRLPHEIVDARLASGSNAASVWWLNGREVISLFTDRQTVIDDGVSKRVTLKKGVNVIRAAIINAGGATDFCARLLDANARPITGVTIDLASTP